MDYRKLIVESGKRMLESGLTVDTFGNISVLGDDGRMYVTPSSMDYRIIQPEDICVMDLFGNIVDSIRRPSIESALHREIYRVRPDVKAIVHTHPVSSTAISCMGLDVPVIIDECWITLKDEVKTVPYERPGTPELARAAAAVMETSAAKACLLQSHGAVCCGGDMEEAFRVASVLEMVSEIYLKVLAAGRDYKKIR